MTDLFATDADTGDNGDVGYEIIGQNQNDPDERIFTVDPELGSVTCHKELDRETLDTYQLRVVAHDKGNPRLSSTATVLLTVSDINDNAPRL